MDENIRVEVTFKNRKGNINSFTSDERAIFIRENTVIKIGELFEKEIDGPFYIKNSVIQK